MQWGDWTSFKWGNSQQLSCQNEDSRGGNPGNEESSYTTKCDKVDQFSKGWTSINLWQERNCRDKGFNKAPRLQPLVCSRRPWCMEWADICNFASTNSFQELKQQSSLPILNREIFFIVLLWLGTENSKFCVVQDLQCEFWICKSWKNIFSYNHLLVHDIYIHIYKHICICERFTDYSRSFTTSGLASSTLEVASVVGLFLRRFPRNNALA